MMQRHMYPPLPQNKEKDQFSAERAGISVIPVFFFIYHVIIAGMLSGLRKREDHDLIGLLYLGEHYSREYKEASEDLP